MAPSVCTRLFRAAAVAAAAFALAAAASAPADAPRALDAPPPDQAAIVASILGAASGGATGPTAVFLAGGVGTYKAVAVAGLQARGLWPAAPAYISVDAILRSLSSFAAADPCTFAANGGAAAAIAAAAFAAAVAGSYNIVFDGSLSTSAPSLARINAAGAAGYRVLLGVTNVPTAYAARARICITRMGRAFDICVSRVGRAFDI